MKTTLRRAGVALAGLVLTAAAGAVLTLGILANTGTPDRAADTSACKAAMSESHTGIVQWRQDRSTRPAACQDLAEDAFNAVAAEWYDEFYREIGNAADK